MQRDMVLVVVEQVMVILVEQVQMELL